MDVEETKSTEDKDENPAGHLAECLLDGVRGGSVVGEDG